MAGDLESTVNVMERQSLEVYLLQHVGVSLKKVGKIYANSYQKIAPDMGLQETFFELYTFVVFKCFIVSVYSFGNQKGKRWF